MNRIIKIGLPAVVFLAVAALPIVFLHGATKGLQYRVDELAKDITAIKSLGEASVNSSVELKCNAALDTARAIEKETTSPFGMIAAATWVKVAFEGSCIEAPKAKTHLAQLKAGYDARVTIEKRRSWELATLMFLYGDHYEYATKNFVLPAQD